MRVWSTACQSNRIKSEHRGALPGGKAPGKGHSCYSTVACYAHSKSLKFTNSDVASSSASEDGATSILCFLFCTVYSP